MPIAAQAAAGGYKIADPLNIEARDALIEMLEALEAAAAKRCQPHNQTR